MAVVVYGFLLLQTPVYGEQDVLVYSHPMSLIIGCERFGNGSILTRTSPSVTSPLTVWLRGACLGRRLVLNRWIPSIREADGKKRCSNQPVSFPNAVCYTAEQAMSPVYCIVVKMSSVLPIIFYGYICTTEMLNLLTVCTYAVLEVGINLDKCQQTWNSLSCTFLDISDKPEIFRFCWAPALLCVDVFFCFLDKLQQIVFVSCILRGNMDLFCSDRICCDKLSTACCTNT